MHRLPLYATPPRAPVEVTPPLRRNPACNRCDLHRDAGIVCAGADGTMYQGPGTILVVTGAPMRRDVLGLGPRKAPPSNAAGPSGASAGTAAPEAAPPHLPPLYAPSVAPVRHAIAAALARAAGGTADGTPPNVVYDWSIRCPLPRGTAPTKSLLKPARTCRPYLAESIRSTRPSRILALGPAAVLAIFGADAPTPSNARRAWGWLATPPGDNAPAGTRHGRRATPVYFLDDPLAALSVPSLRGEYLDDVAWAVTHTPPAPPWAGSALVCSTAEDTAAALDLLRRCAWVSIDLETNGGDLWHPSLRLTSFAITPGPFRASSVPAPDHPALAGLAPEVVEAARAWTVDVTPTPEGARSADPAHHPAPRGAAAIGYVWSGAHTPYQPSEQRAADFPRVLAFLGDPRVGKVGANFKFDMNVLRTLYGEAGVVRNVILDTRLVGRVVDSEAAADLDTMGWLVGCGGHKGEAQRALIVAQRAIKSGAKAATKVLPGQLGMFGVPAAALTAAPVAAPSPAAPTAAAVPPEVAADPDAFAAWFRTATVDPEEREGGEGEGGEGAEPDTTGAAPGAAPPAAPGGVAEAPDAPEVLGPVTGLHPTEDAPGYAIPGGASVKSAAYALLSGPTLKVYNARDTVTTARLAESLAHTLYAQRPNLGFIWSDVERAATETFSAIESRGYPIDRAGILDVSRRVGEMQEKHRAEITRLAPGLNPDSSQQVARFLYGDLGLPVENTTDKGAPATDRKTLTGMVDKHPVVSHLSSLSELSHLRSIYLDGNPDPGQPVGGMLKRIRADNRVHTRYDLAGARTGRLSSGDPNLQNIPRAETEMGRLIKDLFVAPPGWTWVQVDFSQLELRVAAVLSGDAVMAALFASGEDFHMKTGELVARVAFGVSTAAWHALSPKERKRFRSYSKAVAFGLLYGKQVPSLARDLGVTIEQAQSIVDAVLGQFTALARWSTQALQETNRTGIAPTWWRGKLARERRVHQKEYRGTVAVNSRVQGTGSTFCLASCVAVDDWLTADCIPAELVGTVHDSLHILAREDVVDEVVQGTAAIMEGWYPEAPVRFLVDAEVGDRLGSLKGVDIRRASTGEVVW